MSQRGGIDLGGTKIQAVIVNGRGTVVGDARHPTPVTGGPPAVAAEMADTLREAAAAAGVETSALTSVGIGSPGQIDARRGTVANAGNLNDWEAPFPLARELKKALGAPVALGNDVSVATDAEFKLGAGKPYKTILGVFWGTGVGGGIVLDGKPWTGRGAAGEIGHVVVKPGGARCPCGRRGCMEAYAGRRAMEGRARKAVDEDGAKTVLFKIMEDKERDRLTSGIWARAVERGDELAVGLLEEAVDAIGVAVASACNILDVEA